MPATARVGMPRVADGSILLDVASGGQTITYVTAQDSLAVREVRTSEGTITFTPLDEAPSIASGTSECDNPADALKGLPSSLGGTT